MLYEAVQQVGQKTKCTDWNLFGHIFNDPGYNVEMLDVERNQLPRNHVSFGKHRKKWKEFVWISHLQCSNFFILSFYYLSRKKADHSDLSLLHMWQSLKIAYFFQITFIFAIVCNIISVWKMSVFVIVFVCYIAAHLDLHMSEKSNLTLKLFKP